MSDLLVNEELEATLIGAVLAFPKTANEAVFLTPEDFAFQVNRDIWGEIQRRRIAGDAVSPLLVAQSLRDELESFGGVKFLNRLVSLVYSTPLVGAWADEVKNLSVKRQVMDILQHRREAIPESPGSAQEIVADVMADLEKVTAQSSPRLKTSREVRHDEARNMTRPVVCYSTGFHCIDDAMAGGLHAGKSYGIFARMKAGKTMIQAQMAHAISRSGDKCLYVACEMGATEIEHRSLAEELGVNALAFLDNRYRTSPAFVSRVGEAAIGTAGTLYYLDAPGLTFDQLRRDVTHAIVAHGIKGFFLDYLQLVGGQRKGQTRAEHLDDICQWIAEIVRKQKVFACVGGQMNQEGNTRGGEGVRLAFDQVYELKRQAEPGTGAWLEMMVTRYTKWQDVGSDTTPALYLDSKIGPRFTEGQAAA